MRQAERDRLIAERMLEDIGILQQRVEHFALNGDSFSNDRSFEGEIAFDATMNPLYRIVEDAVHLSDEVAKRFPDIPWRDIRGFRNIVAHGYWEIDRDAAWLIIKDDIPVLAQVLTEFLNEGGNSS